ncbi:uncharacterized protein LOC135484424 [Lineus longissimus]|uniref:uncharacterized protein LOC135484424 n=1 Tax=Lineus longissimus TaxID=88925 RepID=UPI002B4C4212
MASRQQPEEDPDIDIDDEEWNGIEDELSTSESSEEEEEEEEQTRRPSPHFVPQDPDLLQRKQEALHNSQDTLVLTKQLKQRNVAESRDHGLYHRQHDAEGLLNHRYKPQVTLQGRGQKDVQNVDFSEDISLDGRRGKEGRHYNSGSGERALTPTSPTTPVLVVSGEDDAERRGRVSPRISPRGQTSKQDPWHGKRQGAAKGSLPSIAVQHTRSESSGLPSIGKSQSNETLPAAGRRSPHRNSRPDTPDIATLSQRMHNSSLSKSSENLRHGVSSPTAPLQSPRLEQRGLPAHRPKSPKVSLRVNMNKSNQLYSKDELRASSPNSHQRSLSAGTPRM